MRTKITDSYIILWLSRRDTYSWAHKSGAWWPCSQLADKSLRAEFDSNGLVDISVNNGRKKQDIGGQEFNAITSDFLRTKLPKNHALHFITVGQFD